MPSRRSVFAIIGVLSISVLSVAFIGLRTGNIGATGNASQTVVTATVSPGRFSYRSSGEFNRGNRPVDAPMREVHFAKPLTIMKTLVSEADYQRCVEAGACKALTHYNPARNNYPVTGTSWEDATDYARWLSRETGQNWRLPNDEEWSYMAGSKFQDDALALGEDADFAQRWIARYDLEATRKVEGEQQARPIGAFGENEHGLVDLAGSVWEWTDTCFTRQNLGTGSQVAGEPFTVCGIRIAAGQHRAYVSDFIRDARGGGCAVGIPPSNLGFRLIRDDNPSLWQRLKQ